MLFAKLDWNWPVGSEEEEKVYENYIDNDN